jgi:hypothetical protein
MNTDFTKQDLDILFEAVEKWEKLDTSGELMGIMFEGMLGDRDPKTAEKLKEEREKMMKKREDESRKRKERGCMLRAKLITIKDSMEANALFDSL